jgi:hypothetical protein
LESVRLFVGYDPDEALAFSVFVHSVHRRSSMPVSVQPLMLSQLKGIFNRPRDPLQSTDFAFTRFLVPYLCGFKGHAIFADGDMICRADIAELWAMRNEPYAIQVVKREDQRVDSPTKFLGRTQTAYRRKNWSSVMLFNCAACLPLSPSYVEQAPGLALHQFEWVHDDDIGDLPREWNHLVGVDEPNQNAKLVHYTLGMPAFHAWRECEFSMEWREERDAMMAYAGRHSKCEATPTGTLDPRDDAEGRN